MDQMDATSLYAECGLVQSTTSKQSIGEFGKHSEGKGVHSEILCLWAELPVTVEGNVDDIVKHL